MIYQYEFWTIDKTRKIADGLFAGDSDALAWFCDHYPAEAGRGGEVRMENGDPVYEFDRG